MELILKMRNLEEDLLYVECSADDNVVDVAERMKIWTTLEAREKLEENFEIS